MASPVSFTIRQEGPGQPEAATPGPSATSEDTTDRPIKRKSVKDKKADGKEEKKKSRRPPGYFDYLCFGYCLS